MNWLTNFVRPKLRALRGENTNTPENLWNKCKGCEQMIFHRDLVEKLYVCSNCGYHLFMPVPNRLSMMFDKEKFEIVELPKTNQDPLSFKDTKKYMDRLKSARLSTGSEDALTVAHGMIGGYQSVVSVMNFQFLGGSMGTAVGEGFRAAVRLAILQNAPLINITSSGGARMQEGALSLMQLPKTIIAVEEIKESKIPYIVILTNPTTGGVTASLAMLGDIHIAEPGALIGFAGPRVIESTVGEKLPSGFQRAEYLQQHGMVDMVTPRSELTSTLKTIIGHLKFNKKETANTDL